MDKNLESQHHIANGYYITRRHGNPQIYLIIKRLLDLNVSSSQYIMILALEIGLDKYMMIDQSKEIYSEKGN